MRNPRMHKLIGSLVTATIAGCMALSVMPELLCDTGNCKWQRGAACWTGEELLRDYKPHIGFDG